MLIEVFFWICCFSIFHSYILYPIILGVLARNKMPNRNFFKQKDVLPPVSIIMAAHNEENVIKEKVISILNSSYPEKKIELLIGLDSCTDNTKKILTQFSDRYSFIKLFEFNTRKGKINIINTLKEKASNQILIMTDANVIFTQDTIYQLVKHFKNESISIVGGLIKSTNIKSTGISRQEKTYLDNENLMKYREGIIWGSAIGIFGGIYAIKKSSFHTVPSNFIVDDFYITMKAIEQKGKVIIEPNSVCYEDISNKLKEEFRRKIRISSGNFQNVVALRKFLLKPFKGTSFAYISHKFLRWLTPFFILLGLVTNCFILNVHTIYIITFVWQILMLCIPLIDFSLKLFNVNISLFRFITHFYGMNLALFIGFIKFIQGVENNVWQPTKRNQ